MASRKSSIDDYTSCLSDMSATEEIPFHVINGLNMISNSIYTNEGQKRIDFVLVFKTKDENNSKARKIFEANLAEEGLLMEYVNSTGSGEYTFVQIYAPWDLLTRYAEVMKLRMPMKTIQSNMKRLFDEEYSDNSMIFTAPYSRDKEYLFDIPTEDREQFFTSSQRAQIVEFILKRKSFSQNQTDVFSMGINKLLQDSVYLAAYPLHEGKINEDIDSTRNRLIEDWASLLSMHKYQPLERVVQYFGVKIAIYFAWVGFYTKMLVPASILGVICFIYGLISLGWDVPTQQICDNKTDPYMCPICAKCNFTLLSHSCGYMKASYLLDNPATVIFAIFMSLWATFYLEMWKRYSAKITYKWDLSDFDAYEEYPRPEYLARLANQNAKRKLNVITRMEEPYIPFFMGKLPHIIISSSFVLLCIVMAIGIMLAIIAYRVSFQIAIESFDDNSEFVQTYGTIFTSLTAALINLVCILVFDRFYTKLAFYLTERELPRTQFEFDNSLTLKMFLFQFVNYYSSIFYIAFFKGKFIGHPGQVTGYIVEECPIGGCFLDLAIQLAMIMVGKQAFGAIIEMLLPVCTRFYNKWKYTQNCDDKCDSLPQWEEDFLLESWDPTSLFYEYLELVLQFGFVTIFVSAFPLAPLFALLNNVFEIRFDAKKIITSFKRPVAQRVKSIGIWYRILDAIGKLSVITNAMIIAFTTSFVPRVMYFAHNGNLNNYLNSSLSVFELDDKSPNQWTKNIKQINSTFCVYNDYRDPPIKLNAESPAKYSRTQYYWELMVWRFAFVVIFENVIVLLTSLMRVLIPDVPKNLRQQKRLHSYLTNELIIRHELAIAKRDQLRSASCQ